MMELSGHEGATPIPITSTYVGLHGQLSNVPPPPPPPPQPPSLPLSTEFKKGLDQVKYKECLKNHAASIGGVATDGCGEFMPSGDEGTLEALKCSACSCHRNFHRKEVEGELPPSASFHHPLLKGRNVMGHQHHQGLLISSGPSRPPTHHQHHHHMIMPLGAALHTSESDEMEGVVMAGPSPPSSMVKKKRFRTKFTPEQKEKMLQFAESAGWRLQRQEEGVIQQFCQEIGVRRRVLKVWMHNNKNNLGKKTSLQLE
ncbi:hypothetical protein Cni_G20673 [Canna indica]|uniref:ZF-HD dimerization-type domain-containing protein n=1 Tax=Canna indica TaxID=4628 RepID=A0AAQ3QHZ4_9LILI|nr:hypothetical protein Cni_G20673 [Canna indica]